MTSWHLLLTLFVALTTVSDVNTQLQTALPGTNPVQHPFLPRDAMRKRGLCCRLVSVRLSPWRIVSTRLKIT